MKSILPYLLTITLFIPNGYSSEDVFNFEDNFSLDELASSVGDIQHEAAATTRGSTQDSLNLVDSAQAYNALKEPFYYYTKPTRRRSLLDSDLFSFNRYYYYDKSCSITPFFMQTSKAHLYDNKTALNGYANLFLQNLNQVIDEVHVAEVDVPTVLALFHNIKIQERRIGTMFQFCNSYNNWNITASFPFLWQEHNFYLTPEEIEKIQKKLGFEEDFDFARQHLISDALGFGDTKITFEKLVYESAKNKTHFGFEITLPTAFNLAKSLLGNTFDKKRSGVVLDLHNDIIENINNTTALEENMINYGEEALDRLSAILIQKSLGNNRHAGAGIVLKNDVTITSNLDLKSQIKLHIFAPATERRFFKERFSDKEVDTIIEAIDTVASDEEAAVELNKISRLFTKQMFPESYKTTVFPGGFLQATTHLIKDYQNWKVKLGSDFWYHTKEHLSHIKARPEIIDSLDIEAGRMGYAYQQNFLISLEKKPAINSYFDWAFHASFTGLSYGIGKTFTFGFTASREF